MAVVAFGGNEITVRGEMFNLTQMWKAVGGNHN